jgi:hypothetical protein
MTRSLEGAATASSSTEESARIGGHCAQTGDHGPHTRIRKGILRSEDAPFLRAWYSCLGFFTGSSSPTDKVSWQMGKIQMQKSNVVVLTASLMALVGWLPSAAVAKSKSEDCYANCQSCFRACGKDYECVVRCSADYYVCKAQGGGESSRPKQPLYGAAVFGAPVSVAPTRPSKGVPISGVPVSGVPVLSAPAIVAPTGPAPTPPSSLSAHGRR